MSGAILQGVPATTLDTDIWTNLPARLHMRVLNLCRQLGATVRANTLVDLSDGSTVNFLYEIDGLRSFSYEYQRAKRVRWLQTAVAVLPLECSLKLGSFAFGWPQARPKSGSGGEGCGRRPPSGGRLMHSPAI